MRALVTELARQEEPGLYVVGVPQVCVAVRFVFRSCVFKRYIYTDCVSLLVLRLGKDIREV